MSNVDFTLAFIGGGNMATSLIRGLLNSGFSPRKISVSDPVAAQLETLSELGVQTFTTNDDAVAGRDAVVLAVKPQVAQKVVAELNTLQPHQLLISIVAGIKHCQLIYVGKPGAGNCSLHAQYAGFAGRRYERPVRWAAVANPISVILPRPC